VAAWLSGSALVSINEVTLCQTQFSTVMGDHLRVGKPHRFVTSHSVGRKMSTSQSAVMLCGCGWGVEAGMVHFTCG